MSVEPTQSLSPSRRPPRCWSGRQQVPLFVASAPGLGITQQEEGPSDGNPLVSLLCFTLMHLHFQSKPTDVLWIFKAVAGLCPLAWCLTSCLPLATRLYLGLLCPEHTMPQAPASRPLHVLFLCAQYPPQHPRDSPPISLQISAPVV